MTHSCLPNWVQASRKQGAGRTHAPSQFLTDQLTLSQLGGGGRLCPPITIHPPRFSDLPTALENQEITPYIQSPRKHFKAFILTSQIFNCAEILDLSIGDCRTMYGMETTNMDQNESFLSDRMVFSNFPNVTDINIQYVPSRYHSRFFVRVGHKTTYAAKANHNFFTLSCHRQTYQNDQGPL